MRPFLQLAQSSLCAPCIHCYPVCAPVCIPCALRAGAEAAKEYKAPKGGLFKYVVCPHYFFELIAWAGMAAAGQHLQGWLTLAGMTAYLMGRAKSTHECVHVQGSLPVATRCCCVTVAVPTMIACASAQLCTARTLRSSNVSRFLVCMLSIG